MKILAILFISSPLAWGDSIVSFLSKVKSSNLEISSQSSIVSAAEAKSKGYSLKPPMFSVGEMKSMEGSAYVYEFEQEIPLSNRLSSGKKSRELSYDLQKKESDFFTREKLFEARLAFISYWKNYEFIKYREEIRDWLKRHLSYAQSIRSDSSASIYALEIESYLGLIENEISTIKSSLETDKAKLKELSFDENYDPGIPVIDEVKSLPEASSISSVSEINLSRLKIADSNLSVAKSSYMPNLFFRAKKLDREMMTMPNQEIMLGIDLPFAFFWQPRAENAEAVANKYMAEAQYRRAVVESEAFKQSLKAKATILKNQMRTLKEISIPAAEKALKYSKNIAPRDMTGLETHRRILQDYVELKSQLLEIRMNYEDIYSNWSVLYAPGATNEI